MNRLVQKILIQVVVDVLMPEAPRGPPRARIAPVVVVVRDVKMVGVDVAEGVAVSYQRALPVVVEVIPGDGYPVGGADDVALAVVVVGADGGGELGAEFWRRCEEGFFVAAVWNLTVMVDPDTSAVLDCDAVIVYDFADGEVAEDDIRRIND
jgi:hypothetical protein